MVLLGFDLKQGKIILGSNKKRHEAQTKRKTKEAILLKHGDFGMVFQVPGKYFVLESCFGKIIGFIWRSKDHLEDEGPIWTHLEDHKGHLVMKGLSKNVENHGFE